MMRKVFLISAVIISNISITYLFASPPQDAIDKAFQVAANTQKKQTSKLDPEVNQDMPEWIKRTNFAIEAGTHQRPKYFFETIQPLLGTQDKEVVFFNQSRISERSSRPTYNIGFGARKIFRESYLIGVNSFYDYQDFHKHSRGGVGFETITDRGLEARVNSYIAISREHLVGEDAANFYYEKVANGLDWELGTPLPYLPFLKIYGGGNWYNFEHFKNKYGWKMRLEYNPVKYSRLVFEMLNDTKRNHTDYRVEGAVTLAFTSFSLQDIIKDIKGAKVAYPKINLQERVLDRVIRDFDITVIKKIKSKGGLTVEGGKSG